MPTPRRALASAASVTRTKKSVLTQASARQALDRATKQLVAMQRDVNANAWAMGRKLVQIAELGLHRSRGYTSMETYVEERLGVTAAVMFQCMRIAQAYGGEVAPGVLAGEARSGAAVHRGDARGREPEGRPRVDDPGGGRRRRGRACGLRAGDGGADPTGDGEREGGRGAPAAEGGGAYGRGEARVVAVGQRGARGGRGQAARGAGLGGAAYARRPRRSGGGGAVGGRGGGAAVAPELKVKIAHWMPRSVDASRQLFWTNLYAACPGNEGAPFEQQHRDTRQRDTVLKVSPSDPTHVASLSYTTRGEIRTSRDDLRTDLDVTLNLNDPAVCARRRSAVLGGVNALGRRGGSAFAESEMRVALSEATTPNARGELPPFAGVLEWWLRERLAPAAAT